MIIGLRLGFIPRLRNDGKGIVYENGLGTFAHGVGIGHQSGAGVLHPDEGILAGIGVGLCLQHLCGYEGGRGEFHVLRELFFRQVQERPGRTGPLRGDNLLPLYGYDCEYDEDDICNLLSIYVYNATPG